MSAGQAFASPSGKRYDVIIVGGAVQGSAVAWFLLDNPDFNGSILVVERDPAYEFCSTSRSNSCIRQQFGCEINILVSRFGAEFVQNLRQYMGGDERVPHLPIRNFGYLYLAASENTANALRRAQALQQACGAGTRLLTPGDIRDRYPFLAVDDIILGSLNTRDEGYFEGMAMFDWLRRSARERGAEYLANEVVAMTLNRAGTHVESVTLATGETIACGTVVNAAGPRAAKVAGMAGIGELPVEPRKRFSYVFSAETPLSRDLPLTIDPTGIHMRSDSAHYLAGCKPDRDDPVDPDDFDDQPELWEEKVWPVLAARIPGFEAIRLIRSWVGHYDYNRFDRNAILGPHGEITNFLFINGFSGHGLQQAPAMGRGLSEWIIHGEYQSLDLSAFAFDRIVHSIPFAEDAVI
ncbi:MAG: FAD-binding oxidoreductase [Geminicoccaceae bacterium]